MKFNRLKIALYLLVLIAMPVCCFANGGPAALLTQGNTYYAKGKYKDAITAYQKIINSGYQSPVLYFNIGNAYYKNGDIAPALLYYEKAHKLTPGDEDINFNIQLVNLKTTDKIDAAPEFFLAKWWRSFILSCSGSFLAILSIALFLVGSAALVLYFFSFSVAIKKAAFYVSIILFATGVVSIAMAGLQMSYFNGHRGGIIFNSIVNVKAGPSESTASLFVIHDGTKVNMGDKSGGWVKIKLANGNEGWIKAADLREI